MKINTTPLALGLLLLAPACDQTNDAPPTEEIAVVDADDHAPPTPSMVARAPHRASTPKASQAEVRPVMPGAKAAFATLTELVESEYVGGPLSQDELWTGAMEGVLGRLLKLHGHQVNTLMTPREYEELMIGTKGRLVGVGVAIERVGNVVVVDRVLPDGPAALAGLVAGDRILAVNGDRLEPLPMSGVVDRLRGQEGTAVELFVQRDTEEWTETITRAQVAMASVQSAMLRGDVGYLRITSFSRTTPAEIDGQLAALSEQGAASLVLDLRHCPGGLLETSLEAIARFVPEGELLMTIDKRGKPREERRAQGQHPWQTRPIAVLVGHKTASSAELMADAIRTHDRGVLVGETTWGKHTVESLHELPEGWAVKLSVSRFGTASGETRQGVGVSPDIRIPTPADASMAPVDALDPSADATLGAAVELLGSD